MMEENNNIFLASRDALMYLAKPIHKRTFAWGHPLSAYLSYDQFFYPVPLYSSAQILDDPPPFP